MTSLMRRVGAGTEPFMLFDRMDRLFGEWMRSMPVGVPLVEDVIRVDEYQEGKMLVVRAELPEQPEAEQPKRIAISKG